MDVLVRFRTLITHTYTVERKDDLTSNVWTVVANNVAGTDGSVTVPDVNGLSVPRRFYHVIESP